MLYPLSYGGKFNPEIHQFQLPDKSFSSRKHYLLSRPEWVESIEKGKAEIAKGIKGKSLEELED